jgi:hypothetical protein
LRPLRDGGRDALRGVEALAAAKEDLIALVELLGGEVRDAVLLST